MLYILLNPFWSNKSRVLCNVCLWPPTTRLDIRLEEPPVVGIAPFHTRKCEPDNGKDKQKPPCQDVSPFKNGDFPIAILVFEGFQESRKRSGIKFSCISKLWIEIIIAFQCPEFFSHHCWVVTWGKRISDPWFLQGGGCIGTMVVTGTQRPCQFWCD